MMLMKKFVGHVSLCPTDSSATRNPAGSSSGVPATRDDFQEKVTGSIFKRRQQWSRIPMAGARTQVRPYGAGSDSAPTGHISMQAPQEMQNSSNATALSSSSRAPTGHTSPQQPQPMHKSVFT